MKIITRNIVWICCLLCMAVSCSNDTDALIADGDEVVVHLSLSPNQSSTRVSLQESAESLDLTTHWENGDEVDLYVMYDGKVEHIGKVPIKGISEDGKDCIISYKKPKVVEDGLTEEYTLMGIVGAATSCTESEVYCNASLQRVPFEKFKVPAVFSIVTGFNQTNAVFKPYGVYEILHVSNTSDKSISFSLKGFEASPTWFRLQGAIRFSDSIFVSEAEAAQSYTIESEAVTIPSQGSDAIVSWYLPNGNLINNAVISATIDGKTVKSSNKKSSDVELQLAHAYHMYATWDGAELKFMDGGEENLPEAEIETITVNGYSFDMIKVEGGSFMMGGTNYGFETDRQTHKVTLSTYYMSKYEVTNDLVTAVMGRNYYYRSGKSPAIATWTEALAFVVRLNLLTGRNFSLPTEAEWEYAARGGKFSRGYKYSGSDNLEEVAATKELHVPGTLKPNELGIYDMTGNLAEWCYDHPTPYSQEPQTNPLGGETGEVRVVRGGGQSNNFTDDFEYENTYRTGSYQDIQDYAYGIRLVLSPINKPDMNVIEKLISDMVYVEGGTYMMGATDEQLSEAKDDEKPAHQVTVPSFFMCKYEMTELLEYIVTGWHQNGSLLKPGYIIPYATHVEHDLDCYKVIAKLNELTGYNFRLPTEAEWEWAARGGIYSKGYKYAGSNSLDDVAWTADNIASDNYMMRGGLKKPNELGLYDMSGNCSELCQDYYNPLFYSISPSKKPVCGKDNATKIDGFLYLVFRGGTAAKDDFYSHDYRVSARSYGGWDGGVRLVLDNLERK